MGTLWAAMAKEIIQCLARNKYKRLETAQELGITRQTLRNYMDKEPIRSHLLEMGELYVPTRRKSATTSLA